MGDGEGGEKEIGKTKTTTTTRELEKTTFGMVWDVKT
jgi:hypothetical protein